MHNSTKTGIGQEIKVANESLLKNEVKIVKIYNDLLDPMEKFLYVINKLYIYSRANIV